MPDPLAFAIGQVWTPQTGRRAKPRQITWVGLHPVDGSPAVRWVHPGDPTTSMMLTASFQGWVKLHLAKPTRAEANDNAA